MRENESISTEVAHAGSIFARASAQVPSSVTGQAAAIAIMMQESGIVDATVIRKMGFGLVQNDSAISSLLMQAEAAHVAAKVVVSSEVLIDRIKGIVRNDFLRASDMIILGKGELTSIIDMAHRNTQDAHDNPSLRQSLETSLRTRATGLVMKKRIDEQRRKHTEALARQGEIDLSV